MRDGSGSSVNVAAYILSLAHIRHDDDVYLRLLGVVSKVIEMERSDMLQALEEVREQWYDDTGAQVALGEFKKGLQTIWGFPS